MQQFKSEAIQSIPEALEHFSKLPDSAQVRLPVIKGLLGISSATAWRMVKVGTLKTYKLTDRTTTFNVGEIRNFLATKAVA